MLSDKMELLKTAIGDVTIARATIADRDKVFALLDGASNWLHQRGIPQWLPGQFTPENVGQALTNHDFYLAQQGETPVGTLALFFQLPAFDQELWGDVLDDAVYVHRLAVNRAYSGQNIGKALLNWAGEMAAKTGKKYLRLDCWADNVPLCRYYVNSGFEFKGRWEDGDNHLARFEKALTT